jgi:hypothetical protein
LSCSSGRSCWHVQDKGSLHASHAHDLNGCRRQGPMAPRGWMDPPRMNVAGWLAFFRVGERNEGRWHGCGTVSPPTS